MINEAGKAHGADWLKWLGHLAGRQDIIGAEVGTFRGESAEWMLENIFTHPTARYICCDCFEGSVEHRIGKIDCSTLEADTHARLDRFMQVKIVKSWSHDFLRGHFEPWREDRQPVLDFLYVDAAHDSMNVLRDSVLGFDLLKPGGILTWDDYLWEVMPDPLDCPKLAIDSFLKIYSRQIKIIEPQGWQICCQKL